MNCNKGKEKGNGKTLKYYSSIWEREIETSTSYTELHKIPKPKCPILDQYQKPFVCTDNMDASIIHGNDDPSIS